MSTIKLLPILLLAVFVILIGNASALAGPMIFWTSFDGRIVRSNLDGSNVEVIFQQNESTAITGPSLDNENGKIYWSDYWGGKIQRANFDGSNVEDVVTGSFNAFLAADFVGGKLYWLDRINYDLCRANLDGSQIEYLITGTIDGGVLAVDSVNSKLYWGSEEIYGEPKIKRANLDGTMIEDVVEGGPWQMKIYDNKLFWSSNYNRLKGIWSSDLDGSNLQLIVPDEGIGIDIFNEKLYWSDLSGIYCADLDGSNPTMLFTPELWVAEIAISPIPEPVSLVLLAGGAIAVLRKRVVR